jgi:uroporphyrin-III C-methyltransferase
LPRVTFAALSSSSTSSPFTEANSEFRYQRETWTHGQPSRSCGSNLDNKSNDIALQLPELKELLEALRVSREMEGAQLESTATPGRVGVGTGPGDPELITVKAVRAIEKADLILYDRLVSNDVLELDQPDARLLYVGKTAGYHSQTQVRQTMAISRAFCQYVCGLLVNRSITNYYLFVQEEIHQLLLSFAEVGANVVRLKGSDPLVCLSVQVLDDLFHSLRLV